VPQAHQHLVARHRALALVLPLDAAVAMPHDDLPAGAS
jgi:hypothetical protein